MKKSLLTASLSLAVFVPATAQAFTKVEVTRYERAYAHAKHAFGLSAVGCRLFDTCHGKVTTGKLKRSTDVLHRMFAPPPAPPPVARSSASSAPTATPAVSSGTATAAPTAVGTASGGGYGSVPGVPASFASCVAMRESTNGAGSSNIYGILPSNGYSSGMSVAAQKQLFSQMYSSQGAQPWAPYDGC